MTPDFGSAPIEVLLVEDNPRDAELTKRALHTRHFVNALTWVQDGAAALDLLFGGSLPPGEVPRLPGLILLDLKLPKVDGLEVLRKLKLEPQTSRIPVVILTSSREEYDISHAYELGVNSYIVKPVEFDRFSDTVSQLGMYWLLLNERQVPSPAPGTSPR
jgi:two-component system response regulator